MVYHTLSYGLEDIITLQLKWSPCLYKRLDASLWSQLEKAVGVVQNVGSAWSQMFKTQRMEAEP